MAGGLGPGVGLGVGRDAVRGVARRVGAGLGGAVEELGAGVGAGAHGELQTHLHPGFDLFDDGAVVTLGDDEAEAAVGGAGEAPRGLGVEDVGLREAGLAPILAASPARRPDGGEDAGLPGGVDAVFLAPFLQALPGEGVGAVGDGDLGVAVPSLLPRIVEDGETGLDERHGVPAVAVVKGVGQAGDGVVHDPGGVQFPGGLGRAAAVHFHAHDAVHGGCSFLSHGKW